MTVRRAIGIALGGMACCATFAAGPEGRTPAQLFPDARFDARIPTQKQATGVEHGARPLRHPEILAYLRALDEASPRCRLETYARSHEGRELVYLAIGDEATVSGLDAFRAEHARSVDPRRRASAADASAADAVSFAQAKAVAWMAYSIHGDELSSADAAVALAYRLVAGEDEAAVRLRRDLVVLIDPCENPDGRERFLAQTAAFAHVNPSGDDEDLSHTTVWPWGRGNHYLFDLNRDWFTLVQPESKRSGVIAAWSPQLVVDSHEMSGDDSYLFDPPRHPFNPFLPSRGMSWHERFAADQARALDVHGFPYYTREWNEGFFPGYGSSWAEYLGSIGILYEMSSTDGTLIKKRDGSTRTYAEAVEHQLTSSIANLTTLSSHRAEVLADFVTHRREVAAHAGRDWPAAWVLSRSRQPGRADQLARVLRAQGIEVLGPRATRIAGLRDARTGEPGPTDAFRDGAYVVPLDQPAGALVRELLDPHVPMEMRFLREEREYLERGRGSRLYDVTAWSLALAYDVDAYWTKTKTAGWTAGEIPDPRGSLSSSPEPVAYVVDGAAENAPTALAELYARQIPVRLAEKPFQVDGRTWPRGSLVVRREGAPADVERQLAEVAESWSTDITAVSTSRGGEGPDLGGSYFRALVAPRIGVLTGWPVSPSDYGAVWHLLDEVVRVRFNGLDVGRFGSADLGRYNVLVFPETQGPSYRAILGKVGVDSLVRWVEGGGTAIGIGSGAEFLADVETGLTKARLRRQALATHPPPVFGLGPEAVVAGGPMRADGLRVAPSPKDDEDESENAKPVDKRARRERSEPEALREGPYDVAPVLGPGARPFAEGHPQGTPVDEVVTLAEWLAPFLPPGKREPGEQDLAWADERLRSFSPRGAFVRIELDRDHWLGWGLPADLPALASADDTLVAVPPVEVPARFADPTQLHLGGLLWPEAAGRLAQTAYVTRESRGRGQVILFLSPPEFRGFTLGTRRLLTNAMLYGPGLGTQWSKPW